jgi:flagellin
MSMSIRSNVSSINAQNNLMQTEFSLNSSLQKLSSGFRITKAGDDAAGLGISSNLTAQIRSYEQAARNASDGVNVVQTAEAALNQTTNILTRLRQLAMQSASDGVGNTERGYIQTEVTALTTEIDRIANATEFNGTALLNTAATSLTFQVGIRNVAANDQITVNTVSATATSLGVNGLSLASKASSQAALTTIDTAINTVSNARATFGAAANRLTSVQSTISTNIASLTSANSAIRDVNVAQETSNMTSSQVLMQAGVAVLAQANQMPSIALKLLG